MGKGLKHTVEGWYMCCEQGHVDEASIYKFVLSLKRYYSLQYISAVGLPSPANQS